MASRYLLQLQLDDEFIFPNALKLNLLNLNHIQLLFEMDQKLQC